MAISVELGYPARVSCCSDPDPGVTQVALIKLNGPQNQTKSHESGDRIRRGVGEGGSRGEVRDGESNRKALHPCMTLSEG